MKRIQTDRWFFGLLGLLLLVLVIGLRDWNSRFERPINGDGKGYYAYLPALFIYNDSQFGFIEKVEQTYYPADRSHYKDFLNVQSDGRVVNKTFPGLSLVYAPFFFISWLIAWLAGFACDGYSLPFQLGISIAHVVYVVIGLRILYASLRRLGLEEKLSISLVLLTLFATNTWYYTLYDHSVGHVFSFFLCALYSWCLLVFFQTKRVVHFSMALIVLALMVVIRPTNALMILFIPFASALTAEKLLPDIRWYLSRLKNQWPVLPLCFLVVALLPLTWYWQTGYFLVYSYGKETFDFMHPHWLEFLFSFEKGWIVWSPFIALMLGSAVFVLWKKEPFLLVGFLIPIACITYILSSWWCWTYGDGFGQRPMIEFIPLIVLLFGVSVQQMSRRWRNSILYLSVPLVLLSLFQGFQFHAGILRGGTTDFNRYWSHFMQWYTDAPVAKIPEGYQLIYTKQTNGSEISAKKPYSEVLELPVRDVSMIKLTAVMSGKHKDTNIRIVVSSIDATFYKTEFNGMYIYNFDRALSYAISLKDCNADTLYAYVWNGGTESNVHVRSLSVKAYSRR